MRKNLSLLLLIIILSGLGIYEQQLTLNAQELSVWSNIRNSARTIDGEILVRCDLAPIPNSRTHLHYFQDQSWFEKELNYISGITYEATVSADPDKDIICRYRTMMRNDLFDLSEIIPVATDSLVLMMAGYLQNDPESPNADMLSKVANDPIGDIGDDIVSDLDITEHYFAYSDSSLYFAIGNDTGEYPTGPFLGPYNFYSTIIINPENVIQDSVFYAVIYSNVFNIITPGLYRFAGLDIDNLSRIGDIDHSTSDDLLFMKCSIEDLVDDDYFGTWPNTTNSLVLMPMTMKVGLDFSFDIGDSGILSVQNFKQYIIQPFENSLPTITNIRVNNIGGQIQVLVDYDDSEGHFPIISRINFDDHTFVELVPLSHDFHETVTFQAIFPPPFSYSTIQFSDNGYDIVEYNLDLSNEDFEHLSHIKPITIYPNPLLLSSEGSKLNIHLNLPSLSHEKPEINIYNVRGQIVRRLAGSESNPRVWDGLNKYGNPVSSGLYFLRSERYSKYTTEKVMVIR